jgi:hypothetical protein
VSNGDVYLNLDGNIHLIQTELLRGHKIYVESCIFLVDLLKSSFYDPKGTREFEKQGMTKQDFG